MRKLFVTRLSAFVMALVLLLSMAATALAAYQTIPYGEQSTAVREMQNALWKKGYYKGSVDGKFGPATKAAVIKFQKAVGLTADGRPGNRTLTALYEGKSAVNQAKNGERAAYAKPTNPRTMYYGCTGRRVERLQYALRKAGVYKGNLDGVYGDLTYEAVRKYQRQKGLYVDGMAGSKTIASLERNTGVTVGSSFQLAVGSRGSEVADVINFLRGIGYTNVTGDVFTEKLAADIRVWQAAKGKTVNGMITEAQYNRIVLGQEK